MQRLTKALVVALAALASLGAGRAAAETFVPYTWPGTWFGPGDMYSGYYDWCGWYNNNTFSKGQGAWGLIAFIDTSGNWRYGKQGYGVLSRDLTYAERRAFVKKPHCRNNSSAVYQGGCFAIRDDAQCV